MSRLPKLFGFVVVAFLLAVPLNAQIGSAKLQVVLNELLLHKILLMRGFPQGEVIEYTENGKLLQQNPGPWTIDGAVQITDVAIQADSIQIFGNRLVITFPNGEPHREYAAADDVTLRIKRDPNKEKETIDALAVVFLNNTDPLTNTLPEYWRYFARKLDLAAGQKAPEAELPITLEGKRIYAAGAQATVPSVVSQKMPIYPPLARANKIQGITTLWVVIAADGHVAYVQVLKPFGFGFEEEAVKAVLDWKFTPGMVDGKPVPTALKLEVPFKL
ncbi:MAG TPA: energy transducer TonB, partial [Candidatus Acidoferrales bacterium]|nr:energy transducer TonB [Candidatus Acidoferrales bacterium]